MDIVYAKGTCILTSPDGSPQRVELGEHRLESDPLVRAYPDQWTRNPRYGLRYSGIVPPVELSQRPEDVERESPVEQATSAPGERRTAVKRG